MSERLSHSTGTVLAGTDLIPLMRVNTTLPQGVDNRGTDQDVYYPFRPTISWLESDVAANISLNGEPSVPLKEDIATGLFILTLEQGMVKTKTLVVDADITYNCTYLY